MKECHNLSVDYKFPVTANVTLSKDCWFCVVTINPDNCVWIPVNSDETIYCKQTTVFQVCSMFARWMEAGQEFPFIVHCDLAVWMVTVEIALFHHLQTTEATASSLRTTVFYPKGVLKLTKKISKTQTKTS